MEIKQRQMNAQLEFLVGMLQPSAQAPLPIHESGPYMSLACKRKTQAPYACCELSQRPFLAIIVWGLMERGRSFVLKKADTTLVGKFLALNKSWSPTSYLSKQPLPFSSACFFCSSFQTVIASRTCRSILKDVVRKVLTCFWIEVGLISADRSGSYSHLAQDHSVRAVITREYVRDHCHRMAYSPYMHARSCSEQLWRIVTNAA